MNNKLREYEINEEELNNVSGGFSGHVDRYHGIKNNVYYFKYDGDQVTWCKAILIDSYEEKHLWWTERVHQVWIVEFSPEFRIPSGTMTNQKFKASEWTMYKYKD